MAEPTNTAAPGTGGSDKASVAPVSDEADATAANKSDAAPLADAIQPPPPTTAEAKRRLLAAAERCDPAALIARNPMAAVATAGVVGLAAGSSRGVPPMILQIIQTAMALAERNAVQAAAEKSQANSDPAAQGAPRSSNDAAG